MYRFFVSLLVTVVALPVAAEECIRVKAYGPEVTVSGVMTHSMLIHEATGERVDCFRLILDKPICVFGEEFGSNAKLEAIQITPDDGKPRLPESGRYSFTGQIYFGGTAWYCEEGVMGAANYQSIPTSPEDQKNNRPKFKKGEGPIGYGTPDKVIPNTSVWKHKAKEVLKSFGYSVDRVEFYLDNKYPVFFVRGGQKIDRMVDSEQGFERSLRLAKSVLRANAGWAYEIIDERGNRYSYNNIDSRIGRCLSLSNPE